MPESAPLAVNESSKTLIFTPGEHSLVVAECSNVPTASSDSDIADIPPTPPKSLPVVSDIPMVPPEGLAVSATRHFSVEYPKKRKRDSSHVHRPIAMTGPLDGFFKRVTAEVAAADDARMLLEWREEMETIKASNDVHAAQAKRQKTKAASQRQRECRSRKMASEVRSGKRDTDGKIIRTKVVPNPVLFVEC